MSLHFTSKLLYVIPPLEDWLRDYAGRAPYDIDIQCGPRTVKQVDAAYATGQSNAAKLWETPHGPRLWHNTVVACAVDVLIAVGGIILVHDGREYEALDQDAKNHGFITGRDWKSRAAKSLGDFGHVEYKHWRDLPYAGHWPNDSHISFTDVLADSESCSHTDLDA